MTTARTVRPRVDFGEPHDGALGCLSCCRPEEILQSLVGAPATPPERQQPAETTPAVEEAFSLFAEPHEHAGGLPRLPADEVDEFLFIVARRSYPAESIADLVYEFEPEANRRGLSVGDCQRLLDELRRRDSGIRGKSARALIY